MAEAVLPGELVARKSNAKLVIAGASLGTLFEWYDFFLYGSLAGDIARHFFSGTSEATAFILALWAFAAGFIARPFGALVFGRIGDRLGRKNTFLMTMTLMGLSTFAVGLLPDFGAIGLSAPLALVALRILQGLAVGGEYGGAVVYVGEHAPAARRGSHTAWINTMATGGLVTSLVVIVSFRINLSKEAFADWGWRLPFLLSSILLAISVWVRLRLDETPLFRRMQAEGRISRAPWSEAFGDWRNLRLVLLAIFGPVGGMTVIWYSAGFYALFFLQRVVKMADIQAESLVIVALVLSAPTYVAAGWLSDRIGRKPVVVTGCALGIALLFPLFHGLTLAGNPALARAEATAPVVVYADPRSCSLQFDPTGADRFQSTSCDIAKSLLAKAGVSYRNAPLQPGARAQIRIGAQALLVADPRGMNSATAKAAILLFSRQALAALDAAGYPKSADPDKVDAVRIVLLLVALACLASLTYGPVAALLVELFPTRVRYTSLSTAYNLAAGWSGGLLPATAFAIVAARGDVYAGLWYPISFSVVGLVVCLIFLPETRGRPLDE